jgi:hypothetical protein
VETTEEGLQRKAIFQDRQRDIQRWTLSELAAQLRTAVDEARRFEADSLAQDRPRGRWEERQAIERVRHGLAVLDTELADTTVHDALALLDAAGDLSAADPDTGLTGRQQCDAAMSLAALGLSWLAVHRSH